MLMSVCSKLSLLNGLVLSMSVPIYMNVSNSVIEEGEFFFLEEMETEKKKWKQSKM